MADISLEDFPKVVYSYGAGTSKVYWTALQDGTRGSVKLSACRFKARSRLCQLQGNLLITGGGGLKISRDVISIDLYRDFSVTMKSAMQCPRTQHGCVYFQGFVYVLGGVSEAHVYLSACERYSPTANSWEAIAALPIACCEMSVLVVGSSMSLFAFAGFSGKSLDTIQELSLERLTWRVRELQLPLASRRTISFMMNAQANLIYFVQDKLLFSFNPDDNSIIKLSALTTKVGHAYGPCFFSRGFLYCSYNGGEIDKLRLKALA
jgi:hypothetical protein